MVLKLLIRYEMQTLERSATGFRLLLFAVQEENFPYCERLLEADVEPSFSSSDRAVGFLYHAAIDHGHARLLDLLPRSADVNNPWNGNASETHLRGVD